MGKNIPLRIGRKSKRELNPVEQFRRKQKQKKNLQQFLTKLHKKSTGEFQSKVKFRRSPSPETNDPMIGELVSSSFLRNLATESQKPDNESLFENEDLNQERKPTEMKKPQKTQPLSFMPLSTYSKKPRIGQNSEKDIEEEEGSSSDDEDFMIKNVTIKPQIIKISQNQKVFKNLIDNDSNLADFFSSINDLM